MTIFRQLPSHIIIPSIPQKTKKAMRSRCQRSMLNLRVLFTSHQSHTFAIRYKSKRFYWMRTPQVHVLLVLWLCLLCLITDVRGGAFLASGKGKRHVTPLAASCGRMPYSPRRQFALYMVVVDSSMEDDDDISQHTIMVDNTNTTTATTKGYRPIESWHKENRNPTHVLDHLKREQAHWKGKFEDLSGDGI